MGGLCLYSQYSGCICGTVKSADYVIASFNEVKCSAEYAAKPSVGNCSPSKCGRMVLDDLFSQAELEILVKLAEQGTMASGGGAGPASILELASSTNSRGSQFVSLFAIREQALKSGDEETARRIESVYSAEHLEMYSTARKRVQAAIGDMFGIDSTLLSLAQPTFFSRLTGAEPITPHDEYWHRHIDTNQYQTFDYTALIYLNNQATDYQGGEFIFDPSPEYNAPNEQRVQPKKGRVSAFTSGAENPHRVERVTDGVRLAFTMGFTCNKENAISDPSLP